MLKRSHSPPSCALSTAAIVGALFGLAVVPVHGQSTTYKAPRGADGKPNLNGIWQALNTANRDIQGHSARRLEM